MAGEGDELRRGLLREDRTRGQATLQLEIRRGATTAAGLRRRRLRRRGAENWRLCDGWGADGGSASRLAGGSGRKVPQRDAAKCARDTSRARNLSPRQHISAPWHAALPVSLPRRASRTTICRTRAAGRIPSRSDLGPRVGPSTPTATAHRARAAWRHPGLLGIASTLVGSVWYLVGSRSPSRCGSGVAMNDRRLPRVDRRAAPQRSRTRRGPARSARRAGGASGRRWRTSSASARASSGGRCCTDAWSAISSSSSRRSSSTSRRRRPR